MSTLQERMAECRAEKDWSQEYLAKLVHSKQSTIASIERRNSTGSPLLIDIAKLFGVNHKWLAHGVGSKTSGSPADDLQARYMACSDDAKWLIDTILSDPKMADMVASRLRHYGDSAAANPNNKNTGPLPGKPMSTLKLGRNKHGSNKGKSHQG